MTIFDYKLASILFRNRIHGLILAKSKAAYRRGHWPQPITLDSLDHFLDDINYFDQPKQLLNIGIDQQSKHHDRKQQSLNKVSANKTSPNLRTKTLDESSIQNQIINTSDTPKDIVDKLIDSMSLEKQPPSLDLDDARLQGDQLVSLAVQAGIYRDLFCNYKPNRDDIHFTKNQAVNLNRLIPREWITDQPFARVLHKASKTEPLKYFVPYVGVSARFVSNFTDDNDQHLEAHTSYYGNFIPASESLVKPSITIDGNLLNESPKLETSKEEKFNNWTPGSVEVVNFDDEHSNYFYTVMMLNLDHLSENCSTLHWMLANIKPSKRSKNGQVQFNEVCDYLPVHGIKGFGYSRYVFIVSRHDVELDPESLRIKDFSLRSRKFDSKSFFEKHKLSSNLTPVGLSWFQTAWDKSSNKIFHDYIGIKAPVFELVQTKPLSNPDEDKKYPPRVPFNLYLDSRRSKKSINEQVLLERLKQVDPYNYKDQYVQPEVPETVIEFDPKMPSWLYVPMRKKLNKTGYWRGLRPASSILALNNNADLDYPKEPLAENRVSPLNAPNSYHIHVDKPRIKPNFFKKKDNITKDEQESNIMLYKPHYIPFDTLKKIMEKFKPTRTSK